MGKEKMAGDWRHYFGLSGVWPVGTAARELHQGTLPVSQEATETQKRRETAKICVYVSGAVQAPGLYYVKPGIRYQEPLFRPGE